MLQIPKRPSDPVVERASKKVPGVFSSNRRAINKNFGFLCFEKKPNLIGSWNDIDSVT